MPGLAGANFDMKDLQRCWMIKAILGNVERGARLLEIGAGEPLVAGALSRVGYDVTVVDPYDGSGNGPREFETFRTAYPDLKFIREQFPPQRPPATTSRRLLDLGPRARAAGGDRLGDGAARASCWPRSKAARSTPSTTSSPAGVPTNTWRNCGGSPPAWASPSDLREPIAQLDGDPETYFVSAEAHNRWRGDLPYDQYTMRRIVSVNLFARA